ncbi:sulfate adenylyltransferase [Striga asiatica]|uniref:Sulfate adenylyltransferase n=1 Tax=Striga asiatica TaxID=4170 RepID=A0A5A7PAV5_STRAF|nr:sulfate adenylyltransferase [Striga asiatica]
MGYAHPKFPYEIPAIFLHPVTLRPTMEEHAWKKYSAQKLRSSSCNDDVNFLDDFHLSRNFSKMKSFTDSNNLPVLRETSMNLGSSMVEMQNDPRCANLLGFPCSPSRAERPYNRPEFCSSQLSPRFYRANGNGNFQW